MNRIKTKTSHLLGFQVATITMEEFPQLCRLFFRWMHSWLENMDFANNIIVFALQQIVDIHDTYFIQYVLTNLTVVNSMDTKTNTNEQKILWTVLNFNINGINFRLKNSCCNIFFRFLMKNITKYFRTFTEFVNNYKKWCYMNLAQRNGCWSHKHSILWNYMMAWNTGVNIRRLGQMEYCRGEVSSQYSEKFWKWQILKHAKIDRFEPLNMDNSIVNHKHKHIETACYLFLN